ncbi:MAG: hypothetical protein ABIY52_13050 [Gemmatimonadaceae bacterium]
MKKHLLVAAGLSMLAMSKSGAQGGSNQCSGQAVQAQDACQQAYDLYQFMAPQLGISLAGGNATLGQGTTLGGLGHFSIGVRANVIQGSLPEVDKFQQGFTGAQSRSLPTKDQVLGLPTADAAIGIFKGIPLGLTNVGGIDAIVSAAYVPTITEGAFSVTPSSNWQFGYGARLGLISESLVLPGVSLTYLQRDLPKTTLAGTAGNNSLKVSDLTVKTKAIRVVASKSLLLFSFAAGVGRDTYEQAAQVTGTVSGVPIIGNASATVSAAQDLDRTNVFFDAALNLPLFKIVGEIGQVSGGTVNTFNTFASGRADKSQQYFSLGLRLGL